MIIGLSGKMGTGKTTLASLLCVRLVATGKLTATRLSFGEAVKREVAERYGFPVEWCYSPAGKAKTFSTAAIVEKEMLPPHMRFSPTRMTVRQALQYYATDYMRSKDPDHWIDKTAKDAEEARRGGCRIIVVDDVRFPNELEYVQRYGVCYRILPYDGWQPSYESAHTSETALDRAQFDDSFEPSYGELPILAERIADRVRALYGY